MRLPDYLGGKIWKLNRAIYGLKQSGHLFVKLLNHFLRELGFKQSQTEPQLFTLITKFDEVDAAEEGCTREVRNLATATPAASSSGFAAEDDLWDETELIKHMMANTSVKEAMLQQSSSLTREVIFSLLEDVKHKISKELYEKSWRTFNETF